MTFISDAYTKFMVNTQTESNQRLSFKLYATVSGLFQRWFSANVETSPKSEAFLQFDLSNAAMGILSRMRSPQPLLLVDPFNQALGLSAIEGADQSPAAAMARAAPWKKQTNGLQYM